MRLRSMVLPILITCILLTCIMPVYANGISLDGEFGDWSDKPELSDPSGDEEPPEDIIMVKWFPDTESGNLYLYCERLKRGDKKDDKGNGKWKNEDFDENYIDDNNVYNDVMGNLLNGSPRFKYWILTVDFSSDLSNRKAYIVYHPPSRRVFVFLFDEDMNYLWSANGKWGEDKNSGKRIEFYIPILKLVSSVDSGYQMDMVFHSGRDSVPDSGAITVSTISTFPVLTAMILTFFVVSGLLLYRLKRKHIAKGVQ